MEAINMIFENYGSERLGKVFKNYWILLLLIKHVMFSFFVIQPPVEDSLPGSNDEITQEISANKQEDALKNLDFLRLMITLAHLNSNIQIEEPIAN